MNVLDKLIRKHLRTDEQVEFTLRRFPLAYWKSGLLILVLILLPAFLFFQLLEFGSKGGWTIAVAWLLALTWAARAAFIWSLDGMVLTNQRLIDLDQKGIFSREVSECPLETIQDIRSQQKGIASHLFDYGTIKVQTASRDEHFELTHVRHPIQMQELLFSIRQKYISKTRHGAQDDEEETSLI